jgi:predicted MPP superfamily phosphohydrolase
MIISAISDLDILGVDLEPFWDILKKAKEPDLLLFAGDMYDFQTPEIYGLILDFINMRKWKCPIVAVFGNHEFDEEIKEIKEKDNFSRGRDYYTENQEQESGYCRFQGIIGCSHMVAVQQHP